QTSGIDRGDNAKPLAVAELFEIEIAARELPFLGEGHAIADVFLQRIAQHVAELFDRVFRLRRVLADERSDSVQRIEQKMRMEPMLQRVQPRRRQSRFGAQSAALV